LILPFIDITLNTSQTTSFSFHQLLFYASLVSGLFTSFTSNLLGQVLNCYEVPLFFHYIKNIIKNIVKPAYLKNKNAICFSRRALSFFLLCGDRDESIHIHVEREESTAKFWITPARLHRSKGFRRSEISLIRKIIEEKEENIKRFWNEYFSS